MKINSIKTTKVLAGDDLNKILNNIPGPKEGSILVVTSKIVSLCQNRVIAKEEIEKADLVEREADYYLPSERNKYGIILTLKDNILIPTAGIDESNGQNQYILWPKDPYKVANEIRAFFVNHFNLENFGIIISDSKTTPLRWGTTGVAIAYSGFRPLNNYIGKPDIFGNELKVTKANVMDGLAAAAVLVMGEGSEQTPMAMIEEIPFVTFCKENPSRQEIEELKIDPKDDLYENLLSGVDWKSNKH